MTQLPIVKISSVTLFSIVSALFISHSSHAQTSPIAWDTFDSYVVGTTVASGNINGGHGWDGAWSTSLTGSNADHAAISATSISFTAGGVSRGGGNSLVISRNADMALSRQLFSEKNSSGQDYFVSFIFQVSDVDGNSGNSTDAFATWGAADGRSYALQSLGGVQGRRGMARVGGNAGEGRTDNLIQYNETYFMVVGYGGWDGSSYTKSTVWLYDQSQKVISESTGLMAEAHVEGKGSEGIIGLHLRTHYLSTSIGEKEHTDRMFNFDDIRFGSSWDSVVSGTIPETSTTALIGAFAAAVAVFGLRRRKANS